jgi:hypothetical protein
MEKRISSFKTEATSLTIATPIAGVYRWQQPALPFRLLTQADLPHLTENTLFKIKFGYNATLGYDVGSTFTFLNRLENAHPSHGSWTYYFQNNYITSHNSLVNFITNIQAYVNMPVLAPVVVEAVPVAPDVPAEVIAGLPINFHLNNPNRDINMGPNP